MRRISYLIVAAGLSWSMAACTDAAAPLATEANEARKGGDGGGGTPGNVVALGAMIFADERLSVLGNQSCQSCHEPSQGFAASLTTRRDSGSVVEGSVAGRFGDRKPPTAAYATISPNFSISGNGAVGGMFWDGRATGAILGNAAADQAMGPFLNPLEQAMPDKACVIYRIVTGPYLAGYTAVYGTRITTIDFSGAGNVGEICSTPTAEAGIVIALSAADRDKVDAEYQNVARAVKEFEASLNKYTSRFDMGALTAAEQRGAKLFGGKGKCQQCHTNKGSRPAFTDFAYHNLGVPKNPRNPVYNYTSSAFDPGLGGFTLRSSNYGKFKTPTVRNTDVGNNRTYMHNGVLVSLAQVVDFYNTRDVLPKCTPAQIATLDPSQYGSLDPGNGLPSGGCWPAPEHPANLDSKNMGALGLSSAEVADIVAFMKALRDQ
jgi:cytochrome c peroxidase